MQVQRAILANAFSYNSNCIQVPSPSPPFSPQKGLQIEIMLTGHAHMQLVLCDTYTPFEEF